MRILVWLLRALLFFILFAFALNNLHLVSINLLFGQEWRAPLVIIVLGAFALGCAFGVLAMLPSWWQHRRLAQQHRDAESDDPSDKSRSATSTLLPLDTLPPRNEF